MNSKDSKLEDLIANLPKELTPENDLWDMIDKRLDAPIRHTTKRPSHKLWRNAAVACLLLITAFIGQKFFNPFLPLPEVDSALINTLAEIQVQHEIQIAQLKQTSELVNWQSSPYSSPVETGIAQLKEAAKQIYQSLKRNPTDRQLWQLWLWTQHREIELLRQGQKLPVSQHSQGATI